MTIPLETPEGGDPMTTADPVDPVPDPEPQPDENGDGDDDE